MAIIEDAPEALDPYQEEEDEEDTDFPEGIQIQHISPNDLPAELRHRIPLASPATVRDGDPQHQPLVDKIKSPLAVPATPWLTGSPTLPEGRPQTTEEFLDEIMDAAMLVVPFSGLYLLLDILVHKQYNRHPGYEDYASRLLTAVPAISLLVFYSCRYPTHFITNSFLMTISIFAGARLIWLVNKASYLVTIQQAPPAGTLWILTIIQLPLGRACLALLAVAAWSWWTEMKFRP